MAETNNFIEARNWAASFNMHNTMFQAGVWYERVGEETVAVVKVNLAGTNSSPLLIEYKSYPPQSGNVQQFCTDHFMQPNILLPLLAEAVSIAKRVEERLDSV